MLRPRPRFTVRSLLVAVAVASVVMLATRWWLSSKVYRSKAVEFARRAEMNEFFSRDYTPRAGQSPGDARRYTYYKVSEFYYLTLMRKYERAAHFPWLPVELDPPEPQLRTRRGSRT